MPGNDEKLSRSFAWMNATQFFGALNDNVFRLLVVFFLLELMGDQQRTTIIAATTILFVLPFLFFSQAAGALADRFSKRAIIVLAKFLEMGVMLAGCAVLLLGLPQILYAVVFMMSAQSALFGPSKYGIIPELVRPDQLSRANGLVVGATYLAIILGVFLPSFLLLQVMPGSFLGVAFFSLGVAAIGVLTGLRIDKTPAQASGKRVSPWFPVEIYRTLRASAKDPHLFLAIFADAYFPFIGGFVQQNILLYAREALGMDWIQSGYLFPVTAVGIGAGALLAGRLSGRNIEFGLIPMGALGLTASCLALHLVAPGVWQATIILFFGGVAGGLFIVPLDAFIQFRSPEKKRGEILACVSFLGFAGVGFSAGAIKAFDSLFGMSASQGFLAMGLLTGALSVAAIVMLPDFLVRFVVILISRIFYRVRVRNAGRLPFAGPALLVANHVTWVDSVLLGAATQRRIRYLLGREIYENRWMKPLFKLMGVIPVSPGDSPRRIAASLAKARAALDEGCLVCIFAEGAVTRNGNMHGFKSGFEHVVKGSSFPIIPVHIGGAWGSVFSYYYGRLVSRIPRLSPRRVVVTFGEPMPPGSSAFEVRLAVQELATGAFDALHPRGCSLARAFVGAARRNWFRPALSDASRGSLNFGRALAEALALSSKLKRRLAGERIVGVFLGASVRGALANIALILLGKVPVNLDGAFSGETPGSAVLRSGDGVIISSREVMRETGNGPASRILGGSNVIFLEDAAAGVSTRERLASFLKAVFCPTRLLGPGTRLRGDETAAASISAPETGEPQLVMLSHRNIMSNIESVGMLCRFSRNDRMCAALTFSDPVGLTCTLWYPLSGGFPVHYHSEPAGVDEIAEMVRARRPTVLATTPGLLLSHVRHTKGGDLASLRCALAGGEIPDAWDSVADSFERKFRVFPMAGYAAAEFSGFATLSVPDALIDKVAQKGNKTGSMGHPVPGVAVKTVNARTGETMPAGEPGMLVVKGPGVITGNTRMPEAAAEAVRDGWRATGETATIDTDGFVFRVESHT